ncbi:hypothetical protein [Rathayibacter sp. AY1A7]|uniref:hypothetical protein n=1 Tax=Rathayibacter sp. AY1A7 TaxID=2080524 RepID=UPI0011B04E14|nr:hypothetical protein [Rathayibacter sp. AY1A7]
MASDLALDVLGQRVGLDRKLNVLDPMCGSGTVLAAAVARGHDAVGTDMDPLAVLMSRVTTTEVPADLVLAAAESVRSDCERAEYNPPEWHDEATTRFVEFWFAPKQIRQLGILSRSIANVPSADVRRVLQVAMSRLIITKSPKASLASDTSHSRPHRTIESNEYDVFAGFEGSVRALSRLLINRSILGKATVSRGDARAMLSVPSSSVDLMITSPPYLNAIDYLRGHRLSLVWLNYTIGELRAIRSDSIGAERKLSFDPSDSASEVMRIVTRDAVDRASLPSSIIYRYAHDMERFAVEAARVTKPGGDIVAVVGNSTLRGNYIRNDEITQLALEKSGFTPVDRFERELPEGRRYLPIGRGTSGEGLAKRMRTEVVIRLKRNALGSSS